MNSLENLQQQLRTFARDRDWEQFHSPKNLAMALSGEVGELLEIFQWLSDAESRQLNAEQRLRAAEEIADVQLYLLQLVDKLNFDLIEICSQKLQRNAEKYPVEKAKGKSIKYTDL